MSPAHRARLRAAAAGVAACAALPAFAAETPPSVETVIVTARPNPEDPPVVAAARQRLAQTPGAVAVVAAETYAARYAPGLSDLVRDVPGVFAQKKWGGDTRLSIRGSGIGNSSHNRGTLLAQDGVPFNEADGFGDFQLIDPLIARYTEVYKGGNALRFGGALLGGAINLVTPTGRTAGADNRLRVDGGSYGAARVHAELARSSADWDVFAAATALKAEGWRQQSAQRQQQVSLSVGRSFGEEREVRIVLSGGDIHQQIPGSLTLSQALATPTAANAANLALNYQRDMRAVRGALTTRWGLAEGAAIEAGAYATWKDLDHPIFQVVDQESRNWGLFGRLDWQGDVAGRRADLFYGLSYRSGDLDAVQWVNLAGSRGAKQAQSRQNATGLDLFAEGRLFVSDRLAVVAGGSYGRAGRDYQSTRVVGAPASFALAATRTYDWIAPRIGLLWEADDGAQVFANITRAVEPPNFSALAPTVGGFTPLKPQESWTGEVGTRGRRGSLTWDLAIYRAHLRHELLNFIVTPQIPAATFNAGPTIHQGLEAGLDWTIAKGLRLRQTYSWSDFRFDGDSQYGRARLPVVPEHHYRAELRYDHRSGWFVAPAVEWVPRPTWADYRNTLRAPAYAVVGVGGGWTGRGGLTVFVDARNLFDERYISSVSAVTDARTAPTAVFFPGEGRSVFGGITVSF